MVIVEPLFTLLEWLVVELLFTLFLCICSTSACGICAPCTTNTASSFNVTYISHFALTVTYTPHFALTVTYTPHFALSPITHRLAEAFNASCIIHQVPLPYLEQLAARCCFVSHRIILIQRKLLLQHLTLQTHGPHTYMLCIIHHAAPYSANTWSTYIHVHVMHHPSCSTLLCKHMVHIHTCYASSIMQHLTLQNHGPHTYILCILHHAAVYAMSSGVSTHEKPCMRKQVQIQVLFFIMVIVV